MPNDDTDNIIEQLLADAMSESDRVDSWQAELTKIKWDEDEADASLDKGFELLKAWNLVPATKVGKGKNAATTRSVLAIKYASAKPLATPGPDGKPVATEAGKYFFTTLNKHFEAGQVAAALPDGNKSTLPEWEVPTESVNASAKELYTIMGAAQGLQATQGTLPRFFLRHGDLVEVLRVEGLPGVEPIGADRLPSVVEQYVRPFHFTDKCGKCFTILTPTRCRLLLAAREELERLPALRVLANAPVIVADGNQPRIITGYDAATGTLVTGGKVEIGMSLEDAVFAVEEVFNEFQWGSLADHSRAIASFLTPALVNGNLLGGRPPVDVSEADKPRTGKGFRQELIALAYNEVFQDITIGDRQDRLEELFDGVLISGGKWPRLDNIRGALNSQKIESFLTQDSYEARSAYKPVTHIDPRRCLVWATSNGMGLTPDLAKRSSIVCIRHQEGKRFENKKAMVREFQPGILGAALRIVAEWIRAGRPRTDETRHDFTWWCQPIDWIVRNYFHLPPIMDGHQELLARVSSVVQTWLRSTAYALRDEKRLGEPLTASSIAAVCLDHDIVIPGMPSHGTERQAAQAVGQLMAKAFTGRNTVTVEDYVVSRNAVGPNEDVHHASKSYVFEPK